MIGICIGVGPQWNEAAKLAADRMERHTGLDCRIINDCPPDVSHPSWLKMRVIEMFPDEDSFLVFDADIACLKHWNPRQLFEELGRPFCAVPDRNWAATLRECTALGFAWPDWYINGGLLMFGSEHALIWDHVKRLHPQFGSWLEQSAINFALKATGAEVCRLPRKFNRLVSGSTLTARSEAINLHMAGSHIADSVINFHRRINRKENTRDDNENPPEQDCIVRLPSEAPLVR